MSKKMLIDATHAEETRVVVVEGNKVEEFDFESLNRRQLAGNIYLAKITRVEPSLQAAFVDYGGNRHGFLAFSEIHPDYYQIPVADRAKLLAEEEAYAKAMAEEQAKEKPKSRRRRRGAPPVAEKTGADSDAIVTSEAVDGVIDLVEDENDTGLVEVPEGPQAEGPTAPIVEEVDETTEEPVVEAEVEDAPDADASDAASNDVNNDDDDDDSEDDAPSASEKDKSIESVADDDVEAEVRPRKPRPRRYKIQEVVKVRQIMLVQVVKEERGNKGAALTTYLSLAGRYCVLMPNTARGGGISRKIVNAADRKKLKEIANNIEVPQGAGLIVRTAGAKRTKPEIQRDYEYLLRMWEQIRALTMKSTAPADIYAEGDLIKRSIRDLYNREIDEILIDGEGGYKAAQEYMNMFMPTHANRIKLYKDQMPLFSRFQVEAYLDGMFNPTVQLKSGGYIVIGVTEALVAIDVNSGKATKENSIEDTALKTNLEAAEEVARQLRLRDLAGLIVIDFIDMEERRNNAAVEKRIKDRLKTDRARIQVGRISGFGLMEMSRQRLRPGMIEATTALCPHCHGTGLLRSDDNQALAILRELEEEGVRKRAKEVLVKVPVNIANYLLNAKREHITMIETRYGLSIRIEAVASMISPDYQLERLKTATRVVTQASDVVSLTSIDTSDLEDLPTTDDAETSAEPAMPPTPATAGEGDDDQPKKKRRRRRRRGGRNRNGQEDQLQNGEGEEAQAEGDAQVAPTEDTVETPVEETPAPKKRGRRSKKVEISTGDAVAADASVPSVADGSEPAPVEKPKRTRAPRKKKVEVVAEEATDVVTDAPEAAPEVVDEKPKRKRAPRKKKVEEVVEAAPEVATETVAEPEAEEVAEKPAPKKRGRPRKVKEPVVADAPTPEAPAPEPAPEPVVVAEVAPEPVVVEVTPEPAATAPAEPDKPKKRGWWSRG